MSEERGAQDSGAALVESRRLWRWQARLLPVVIASIVLLALTFFVLSLLQFRGLNEQISFQDRSAVDGVLKAADPVVLGLQGSEAVDLLKWKTAVLLEDQVVRHRYGQVNATLQIRAWTRQMGFTTGMIMAI